MTKSILTFVLAVTLLGCNNNNEKQQELILKTKELQLKEKEIELREKRLATEKADTTPVGLGQQATDNATPIPAAVTKNSHKSKNRKLRYLYYSNGGLRAYFNDGSIIDCSRCNLTKENIQFLQNDTVEKPIQSYTIEKDGSLLVDGWKHEYPVVNKEEKYEGWAMINYKWFVTY